MVPPVSRPADPEAGCPARRRGIPPAPSSRGLSGHCHRIQATPPQAPVFRPPAARLHTSAECADGATAFAAGRAGSDESSDVGDAAGSCRYFYVSRLTSSATNQAPSRPRARETAGRSGGRQIHSGLRREPGKALRRLQRTPSFHSGLASFMVGDIPGRRFRSAPGDSRNTVVPIQAEVDHGPACECRSR